jgi:hypothetical protein
VGIGLRAIAGVGVCGVGGIAVCAVLGVGVRAAVGIGVRALVGVGAGFAARGFAVFGFDRRAVFGVCFAFGAARRDAAFAAAFVAVGLAWVFIRLRGGAGFSAGATAGLLSELSFHTRAARPAVRRMSAFRISPVGMSPVGMVGI